MGTLSRLACLDHKGKGMNANSEARLSVGDIAITYRSLLLMMSQSITNDSDSKPSLPLLLDNIGIAINQ